MGLFALALFSPKGDHTATGGKKKRKGSAQMKHVRDSMQAKNPQTESLRKSQLLRPRVFSENSKQSQSYDLSSYLMFTDDPEVEEILTVLTDDTSRSTSVLSQGQERLIRFDFDPSVSFDLGINPTHEKMEEQGPQEASEPVVVRLDVAESEVTNSIAFGRETRGFRNMKKTRSQSRFKFSPHNQFLSEKYDAKRIERELALLDSPAENDTKAFFTRKPLHLHVENHEEDEFSAHLTLGEIATLDEFSAITGDGTLPEKMRSGRFDRSSSFRVPNPHEVSNTHYSRQHSSNLIQANHLQNTGNGTNQIAGDILTEDTLSVNNALAVERFISAPRLCKGTREVPSIIGVATFDGEDNDEENEFENFDTDYTGVFRLKDNTKSKKSEQASEAKSKQSQEEEKFKRVWNHIAQLPQIEKLLVNDFDEGVGSKKSYGSPVGVEQFDVKRPWRKRGTTPETNENSRTLIDEGILIEKLKSRVHKILSCATMPTHINVEDDKIQIQRVPSRQSHALRKIKSRRRIIEASYSKDEGTEQTSFRTFATGTSSVAKLKERLRHIESNMKGGNVHIIPIVVQ